MKGVFFLSLTKGNDKLWSLPKFFQEMCQFHGKMYYVVYFEKPSSNPRIPVLKGKIDVVVDIRKRIHLHLENIAQSL